MRRAAALRVAALLALVACAAAGAAASKRAPLVVVGSINLDVTAHLERLPALGETVTALRSSPTLALGGKGANQAVAAARLGRGTGRAPPRFAGRLGDDAHAAWLRAQLAAEGLDAARCAGAPEGTASGQGLVLLDAQGAATSVVLGGANADGWPADDVALQREADALVTGSAAGTDSGSEGDNGGRAALLMLQREVPERVNVAVAAAAAREGLPVLLDAGGEASQPSAALLTHVDYLMPNESELERMTGMPAGDDDAALAAARALLARWVAQTGGGDDKPRHVLATLGDRGALLLTRRGGGGETVTWQPAAPLPGGVVVDATAAGDAFRAAFAVALAEGAPAEGALGFAAAAGAIAASRHGAAPSLPTRREVDALAMLAPPASAPQACSAEPASAASPPPVASDGQGGGDGGDGGDGDAFPLRFASRLNSMRSRRDLAGPAAGADDVLGWVARQGTVAGLSSVYFNYPQHLRGLVPSDVRDALRGAGLAAAGVAMRFPEPEFLRGAFSAPEAATRAAAVALAAEGCAWAAALGGDELVVWSPYDGYDYHLAANYSAAWADTVAAFRQLTDACPDSVRVSVEWKPSDAASRFSFVPNTAAALLLAAAVDRPRFGVTLDVGHALLAGENPAASAALAADAGRLFGVQLGDAHSRLGAEDGLAFAAVHEAASLELLHWLRRQRYAGRLYFDTFPAREDPVAEAELNIRRVKALWRRSRRLQAAGIEAAMDAQDAMAAMLLLERTP